MGSASNLAMAGSSTSFGVWALSLSACGGLLAAVSSDGRLEVRRQEAKPGGQAAAASCRLVSRGLVQLHEAPRPEAAAAGAETRRPRRRRRQHPTARPRRRRTWRCAWSPSTRTQPIANGSPALGPQGCLRASACLAGSRAENTLLYELHEIDTHARPVHCWVWVRCGSTESRQPPDGPSDTTKGLGRRHRIRCTLWYRPIM